MWIVKIRRVSASSLGCLFFFFFDMLFLSGSGRASKHHLSWGMVVFPESCSSAGSMTKLSIPCLCRTQPHKKPACRTLVPECWHGVQQASADQTIDPGNDVVCVFTDWQK